MKKSLIRCLFLSALAGGGCVSVNDNGEAPKITEDMPLEEAIDAAIDFGAVTLQTVKTNTVKSTNKEQVNKIVSDRIVKNVKSYNPGQMVNAVNLYQFTTKTLSHGVFLALIKAQDLTMRNLGWQLAYHMPSRELGLLIEKEITDLITKGGEDIVLVPEMAKAVEVAQLRSLYTVVRQGLLKSGDEPFVKAMIALNPVRAAQDFMNYLALATVEDLRQINQTTVNSISCVRILQHYMSYDPPTGHPSFEQLFYFAISRNQALSELAHLVIERMSSTNKEIIALKLTGLPMWAQVAFVEGSRRHYDSGVQSLLSTLRESTSHSEVVEEIDAIRY
ncbi:MAG: hypothetical protein AB7T49_04465 [Oligoflexales bacterium]